VVGSSLGEVGPRNPKPSSSRLGWLVLGLLVVLLTVELIALTSARGVLHAASADVVAARTAAVSTVAPGIDGKVSATEIVAGPRVQRIAGGRATFLVVVDQTVTSAGGQAQSQLVRVGLLVKVQEKDHKVASVRIL
jgi:hypothetical protein